MEELKRMSTKLPTFRFYLLDKEVESKICVHKMRMVYGVFNV